MICWKKKMTKLVTAWIRVKRIQLPLLLLSSTKIISSSSSGGEVLIILWIVLNKVDQASLWKTITMLVVGSNGEYDLSLHLKYKNKKRWPSEYTRLIRDD